MDKVSKVIVWGIGQIAEVAYFYFTNDSEYEVTAFCVDRDYCTTKEFHGLPVIVFDEIEQQFPPSDYKMFIPISYKNMNKIRSEKYYMAKDKGYSLATYISSKACYYGSEVGENCFIMENNVIQPYTKIGNDVIMWSGNHLGHHSTIGDHCFIASHVVISGNTVIGRYSFLGVNATIRDNITIGEENLIGAGAVILENTNDKAVFISQNSHKIDRTSDQIKHI